MKIEAFFGAGHELFKEPRLQPFTVIVEYEDILSGRRRRGTYSLDVSQFDGLITLGAPAEHDVAEALKKIEGYVRHFTTGSNRLKVETITAAEAREEAEKGRQEARAALERQQQKENEQSATKPEAEQPQ